jgi:hypothetical protein
MSRIPRDIKGTGRRLVCKRKQNALRLNALLASRPRQKMLKYVETGHLEKWMEVSLEVDGASERIKVNIDNGSQVDSPRYSS